MREIGIKIEINGNLCEIDNYDNFSKYISLVVAFLFETFDSDLIHKIDLYIDNATSGSGYTPITTIILKRYITIKLGISNFLNSEQIVYQFSHELCHYIFYSIVGLSKTHANEEEESICSAMSLLMIKKIFPERLDFWINHVRNLNEKKYREGVKVANEVNYDIFELRDKILKMCNNKKGVDPNE